MDTVHHAADKPQQSAFDAAEDAHGSANPEPHMWPDRFTDERFAIEFAHFEGCTTRDGKTVETIVGRLRDGTWSREWLFRPDDPKSRGWRAQELEFIEEIRADLKPGDILVLELGAERPSTTNSDRSVRPFRGTHHPQEPEQARTTDDEAFDLEDEAAAETAAALESERDEIDDAVSQMHAPLGEKGVAA